MSLSPEIPGLGAVTLRTITFGAVRRALEWAEKTEEARRPTAFANAVLAEMVEVPSLTPADIDNLSKPSLEALVNHAVESLSIHEEYDALPDTLPARERLYQAHQNKWLSLTKSIQASTVTLSSSYSPQVQAAVEALSRLDRDVLARATSVIGPLSDTLASMGALALKIQMPAITQDLIRLAVEPLQKKMLEIGRQSDLRRLVDDIGRRAMPEPILSAALSASMLESPLIHTVTYPIRPTIALPSASEMPAAAAEAQRRRLVNAYDTLSKLEQSLRSLIQTQLASSRGPAWWKHAVPDDVRRGCDDRKAAKEKAGETAFHPIYYAYVHDYEKIILRKDNWIDVFAPIFGNRIELEATFMWVGRVRDPVAHTRPVPDAEYSMFVAAAGWLLRRIVKALPPEDNAAI